MRLAAKHEPALIVLKRYSNNTVQVYSCLKIYVGLSLKRRADATPMPMDYEGILLDPG